MRPVGADFGVTCGGRKFAGFRLVRQPNSPNSALRRRSLSEHVAPQRGARSAHEFPDREARRQANSNENDRIAIVCNMLVVRQQP
jgi:hypothetical protein